MSLSHDHVKEVRDPIYGFIKLSEAEWDIVNCPEFQRLRDIRQLAMGHLVYPGANHTRFEHSLGCLHLATLMFDSLVERDAKVLEDEFGLPENARERARQVLRLAALLHDLGHPPFSHSGEGLLPVKKDPRTGDVTDNPTTGKPARFDHEEMTALIVRDSTVGEKIDSHFKSHGIDKEEVIAVATDVKHTDPEPYSLLLHDMLAGEVGADRVDYLLRDAYHSGQKVGDFDYRRLIGTLMMVPPPKEAETGPRIGFDDGGWLVAEQMIVARYLMYQSLYFHKTKRIFEVHLERFMQEWLKGKFGAPELPSTVDRYVRLSDSNVLAAISRAACDTKAAGHDEACRFRDRSHARLAKELILADNYRLSKDRRIPIKERFDKLKSDVRAKFDTGVLSDEPDRSATQIFEQSPQIWVQLDGTTRYLGEISEIVRGMADKIWRGRIYADAARRKEVKCFCEKWLEDNPAERYRTEGARDGAVAEES